MVVLTGASGFLGTRLVAALKQRQIDFLCLGRRPSKTLEAIGCKQEHVDFDNASTLQHFLNPSITVIHLLGLINGSEEDLQQVNVAYARTLVHAAQKAGVAKMIWVSSVAAIHRHGFYGETKYQGEQILIQSGLPYTLFRPAYIFGAGDTKNTQLMIKTLKRLPIVPLLGSGDFKLQPVYVEDAVSLILQAIEKPAQNQCFNVAGENQISLKEMLQEFSVQLKVKRVLLPIPLKPIQWLLRLWIAIFPYTKLPAKQILELDKHEAFDIHETAKVFDFKPRSFQEGCRAMFDKVSVCAAS